MPIANLFNMAGEKIGEIELNPQKASARVNPQKASARTK